MKIKLKSLKLKNFKGIKDFQMDCNGEDVEIRGDNATGKTTVFDSFLWLLFDKDSEGKKDFDIKTLDKDNNPIHKLEHEVEALLEINEIETMFKRTYKENWVKRRGSTEPELTGHTTGYWVDEVPTKKKDYDAYITNLIDETTFKLLTDIRYFTEKIKWKERRSIITDIAAAHMNPVEMPTELEKLVGNKDLEDYKKIIAEKKKKLKKELEAIPIRVDEINNSIEDTEDIAVDSLEFQIRGKTASIQDIENQILDHGKIYESNSQIKAEIYKKKDRLREIHEDAKEKKQEPIKRLQEEIYKIDNDIARCSREIDKKKQSIIVFASQVEWFEKDLEDLRLEWFERNKEEFVFDEGECSCPTCGQDLPKEDIENTKNDMKKSFEFNKKKNLDRITNKGKGISESIEKHKSDIENAKKKLEELQGISAGLEKSMQSKKQELEKITIGDIGLSEEYIAIEKEIERLEKLIVEPDERAINELKVKKQSMEKEIDEIKDQIRVQEQNEKLKARTVELLEEEKALANQLNELEKQEFQIQEYTTKKINALENTVNNMFKNVKFKMFQEQLNGGMTEVCEILINGVPYSSANYAGRINAGLDIIRVLSKEYSTFAPVFVDNSESVTELMELDDQQMIKLIVDKNYKQLAIVENKNIEEAV